MGGGRGGIKCHRFKKKKSVTDTTSFFPNIYILFWSGTLQLLHTRLRLLKKIFEKIFAVNFIVKKHFKNFLLMNSLKNNFEKFLIVNFRLLKNFLLLNSSKKISKIFTVNSIEKNFRNFFRKSEKTIFCPPKKGGYRGV